MKTSLLRHVVRLLQRSTLATCAALAACSGDNIESNAGTITAHYVLAPVNGGTCSLSDARGTLLEGPVSTSGGVARFGVMQPAGVTLRVTCSGGTYTDEATGQALTAPTLRSYFQHAGNGTEVVVSPFTEIAVRLLGSGDPATGYRMLLDGVARTFGLGGIAIGATTPRNINDGALGEGDAARHGAALAALSQVQAGETLGASAESVIQNIVARLDATGQARGAELQDTWLLAIEAMLENTHLTSRIDAATERTLDAMFDAAVQQHVGVEVTAIDTSLSLTQSGNADNDLVAGQATTLAIIGRGLYLGLEVRLGGNRCQTHDLSQLQDAESDSNEDELLADCLAQPAGTATLVVKDKGTVVSTTELTVGTHVAASAAVSPRALVTIGTGPSNIAGQVTGIAPTVDLATGGLRYDQLRTFTVKGVVVELLDHANGDALLATTSTDGSGNYVFAGVNAGVNTVIRVKAQLFKQVTADSPSSWNFTVRDNTSETTPKAAYSLDAPAIVTAPGDNAVNIVASLGFDSAGNEIQPALTSRQSAPFSILEVVYNAATNLQATDPAVTLPQLNIYWSHKNVGAAGDKNLGQINTSHYTGSGTLPGVFILGKADVDTDEFDQGVIGHEFGHYLQAVLAYSDNPGGAHATGDYKDASLAFGEGYGTAVGGLLSRSPYYVDTSGVRQAVGSVTDLTKPTPDGRRKGFYSEESVGYVMYNLGVNFGFGSFWRAVSTMKARHHSATLAAFLAIFIEQNPATLLQVAQLMQAENIRSADAYGVFTMGAMGAPAEDAAINAAASKGANDLEQLYVRLVVSGDMPGAFPTNVTPGAASFCLNNKLPGANHSNGLGMLKRFTFAAPFTAPLGLRPTDNNGALFNDQGVVISARDSTGTPVPVYGWEQGYGYINVVAGRTYTVLVNVTSVDGILGGNRCNNTLTLWRLAAEGIV